MKDTATVPSTRGDSPAASPPVAGPELTEQLLARAEAGGVELLGPDGLLSQVTRAVLERALAEEMTGHLGYDKHDPAGRGSGNSRNGSTPKTVLTDIGAVDLACRGTATAASSRRSSARASSGWRGSTTGSSRCMRAG